MKKLLFFLFILLPIYLYAIPSVNVTKTSPSGNPISCGDVTYNVSILNPGPGTLTLTSFTLDYDNRITLVPTILFLSSFSGTVTSSGVTPGDPTHNRLTITGLMSSGSPLTIATSSSAVNIFTYTYHIPCMSLPGGSTVVVPTLTETVTCGYNPGALTMMRVNTSSLDYANLYISPTGTFTTTDGNMGSTAIRKIRLESAGTSPGGIPTNFEGYLSFTDRDPTCDLYRVIDVQVQKIARSSGLPIGLPLTFIGTVSYPFAPTHSPGAAPMFTTTHFILNRATEYLEITETIRFETSSSSHCIYDCSPDHRITSYLDIDYGCEDPSTPSPPLPLCNHLTTTAFVNQGHLVPNITQGIYAPINSCFLEPSFTAVPLPTDFVTHTRTITNMGGANAYNVHLKLTTVAPIRSTDIVTRNGLSISVPAGIPTPTAHVVNYETSSIPFPTCIHSFQNLDLTPDDPYEPISSADWLIDRLGPGQSVVITFKTYRCCPNDTNTLVGSFSDPEYIDRWRIIAFDHPYVGLDECGDPIRYTEHLSISPAVADLTVDRIIGPSELTGDMSSSCDITDPAIYELPILKFCQGASPSANALLLTSSPPGGLIHGKLKVVVITESGLNPTPDGTAPHAMRITSMLSPFTRVDMIPLSGTGSFIPGTGAGSGGRYEAEFDLTNFHETSALANYANLNNFLEHAYLSFPISPCCNGAPTPHIWVEFYLQPNPSVCADCWIPIAKAVKKIQLHCPGCVTPGIITNKCVVKRTTAGYIDVTNNGLADNLTTYVDVDAMIAAGGYRYAPHSFMQGDNISMHIEAYGQDGDDADDGVTYARLMSDWAMRPGYPTEFTYLNIDIVNPCAASSQYDWTPYDAELKVKRGSSTTTISLLDPAYIVNTGGHYFYHIPSSVTGAFIIDEYDPNKDHYEVNINFHTCGNGDPTDCEITARMWWSGVSTHDETTFSSISGAGDRNGDTINHPLPPGILTDYDYRAYRLTPEMYYLCEANGDIITGYHLKETYSSIWKDNSNPSFPNSTSCDKKLINTYSIRAVDVDPDRKNVFPFEYRPLLFTTVEDYFKIPDVTAAPGYQYSTVLSSSGSSFVDWTPPSGRGGFAPNNRVSPSVVPSTLTGVSGSWSISGSSSYYRMLTDASRGETTPSPYYLLSDEQTNLSMTYVFEPTLCVTVPSPPPFRYTIDNNDNHAIATRPITTPCSSIPNRIDYVDNSYGLRTPNPRVLITATASPVIVYSYGTNYFYINVQNISAGDELAENITIHIPSPTSGGSIGLATIDAVTPSGITPTLGCTINSDGSIDCVINYLDKDEAMVLKIPFILASCASPTPSINITYKFGCSPDLSCITAQTCTVNLQLADVTLFGEMTLPTSTISVHPCTPVDIHTQFYLTNIGQVSDLKIYVTLPTGVVIDPTSLTFSATVLPGTGCTASTSSVALVPLLSYPVIPDVISSGFYTRVYTLDRSLILTAFPYPCSNELLFNFNFKIGTCVPSTIYPIVDMTAKRYCDNSTDPPIHSTPILTREIDVIPDPGHSYCADMTITRIITPATCLGMSDGQIDVTVAPVGGTYSYRWSSTPPPLYTPLPFPNSEDRTIAGGTAVTVGTYYLTVTDGYGCEKTDYFTVPAGSVIVPSPTLVNSTSTCEPGAITIDIGTTGGFTYTWTCSSASPSSGSFSLVSGSIYTTGLIHFTDPNNPGTVIIRTTTSSGCYSEMTVIVPGCCAIGNGPVPPFTPFDMILNNTDLSSYAFTSALSYRINGVVYVSSALVLTGKTFYMEPNSEIRVDGGATLTLNSCIFVACSDNMWRGFNLQPGSHLIGQRASGSTTDTRIYDAITGITSWGGADYDLTNVDMNRNYIDVDVKPYTTAAHPSTMNDCNFFCQYESWGYYGLVTPPSDGSLFSPHTGEKTKIGVNVKDCNTLTIGSLVSMNYLSDMNYGIYAENSKLEILHNHFKDMRNLTGTTGGDAIYFTGNVLSTYPKNIHVNQNVFTSLIPHACVYLLGSEVEGAVENNSMDAHFGVLSNALGGPSSSYRILNIHGNIIKYSEGGIKLDACNKIKVMIGATTLSGTTANHIYGPPAPPPSGTAPTGITLSAYTLNTANALLFSIRGNDIQEGQGGISIQSSTSGAITYPDPIVFINDIISNGIFSTDASRTSYRGIGIQNGHSIRVTCNNIQGRLSYITTLPTPANANKAIVLSNSQSNLLTSNTMNYMNMGIAYTGDCSMPNKLALNLFQNMNYHIYTGTGTNKIGDQLKISIGTSDYFQGNQMTIIMTRPGGYALYNPATPLPACKYTYARRTGLFDPSVSGLIYTIPTSVALTTTTPTSTYPEPFTCAAPTAGTYIPSSMPAGGEGGGGGEMMMMDGGASEEFALDLKETTDETVDEDAMGLKKISEELLYDMIRSDSVLLINDTLRAFYDEKSEEHTGKLNEIKDLIDDQEYTEADAKLSVLPLSNEAEEINKTVFGIYNQMKQRGNYLLTGEEMETLMEIAGYCPIRYGQAVYSARVLINTQYGYETMFWDDDQLCVSGIDYRKANPNTMVSIAIPAERDFMIYPNPASTELNFVVKNSKGCIEGANSKIEILDILGNSVIKKEYNGFMLSGKINISILANGAYVFKYSCGINEFYRESFVVNK